MKRALLVFGLFMFIPPLFSQVIINEYSASNLEGYTDNYDAQEDWIELYNTGSSSVNIGGYHLSDSETNSDKWEIPSGITIPANGYLKFWCSGRNEVSGTDYHTNFKLKQTKVDTETIVFADSDGTILDSILLQKTQLEHSMGRSPNGSSTWKIFTSPTLASANTGNSYDRYAAVPEMNLDAGFYNGSQSVTITTAEPNSSIHYTVNGNIPNSGTAEYSGNISIASTQIIRAIVDPNTTGVLPSFMTFNTYFINESHSLPVISVSANQMTNLLNGNINLRPEGTMEYFDADGIRKEVGYGEYNKHGQDSWAWDQRSFDYIARDEMGYHDALNEALLSWSERDSYQKVIIRASGDDNYPGIDSSAHMRDLFVHKLANKNNLKVDMRKGERCVVYANGQYWGVYSIREKVSDADYTKFYYGQDKYNIQYLMNWGTTWAQYGGQQAFDDWDEIHSFAMNNDLSNQANYEQVAAEIDVTSLVDYILINSFAVCTDWINWNTSWWRGLDPSGQHTKWGYVLWDEDATFNHYINYTNVPNENPDADPCYPEEITLDPEQHIDLLNKLLENDVFYQYYITRYMDLNNTVFTEEETISTLEGIENSIAGEMPRHIGRWGGNMNEWEANVQKVKDFIRDRIDFLPGGLNDCYALTGPYDVTLNVQPEGAGQIQFNSLTIDYGDYIWNGTYHGGINMNIKAIQTNPDYVFDHWELENHTVDDAMSLTSSFELIQAENLIAVFVENLGGPNIVINEINYKDASDFEVKDWVELYNNTPASIDISGWVFKDSDDLHEFIIPDGVTMPSNSYIVLVEDQVAFQALFPSVSNVYGDFDFGLSGGGELIRLFDNNGALINSVTYDDQLPWPEEPDGLGPTLELIDPSLDNSLPESWQACYSIGFEHGTPGAINNQNCTLATESYSLLNVSIYPNPADTQTTIVVPNATTGLEVVLSDMLGREVKSQNSKTNSLVLERGNLNAGVYLLKISNKSGTLRTTKRLILK
ncbi:lamin tail domain-containing protein [Psychroserpens sp.]